MQDSKFYIVFGLIWTFTESFLALSGINNWNPWILRGVFVCILSISIFFYIIDRLRKRPKHYYGKKLNKQVKKSIRHALIYLEKENVNNKGQRLRLTPSIMESATVIGSIFQAAKIFDKKPKIQLDTLEWLFSGLKKQFRDNSLVKFFDCARCNNGVVCNVAYFDYLSHFYYAEGTKLFSKFCDEFQFMREVLKSRFISVSGTSGWPLFDGSEPDILATSTNLLLHSIFPSLTEEQERSVISTILDKQEHEGTNKGAWIREVKDSRWCTGNISLITTHRAIEALMKISSKFPDFEESIQSAIKNGLIYLKSCDGSEMPVNYEYRMGIDDAEILRGTGHIIQALVKVDEFGEFVSDRVNYLVNVQSFDGSYNIRSSYFHEDRELSNKTDVTAFITRTLCIYINAQQSA